MTNDHAIHPTDGPRPARARLLPFLVIFIFASALPSCGSVFKSYPSQLSSIYEHYRAGEFEEAAAEIVSEDYEGKKNGPDDIVWLLEEGKLLHAAKRFEESNRAFSICEKKIEDMENRPSVSLRDGLEEAAAVGSNTNAIPYKANPAEKILLYTYKALNYLSIGDLEGALVETRKADAAQKESMEKYAKEIEAAREDARRAADAKKLQYSGVASNGENKNKIGQLYSDLNGYATSEYANFTNPFTSYLSAACYIADGDREQAAVDFRRLLEVVPGHAGAAADAQLLQNSGIGAFHNSVYVFFENGAGPVREETRIDLVVPVPGYITYVGFAFPRLQFHPRPAAALMVRAAGETTEIRTERIASVDGIVASEFKQQLPSMIARIIVSTLAKAVLSNVNKKHGDLADILTRVAVGLWSAIVNNADLRIWMTLGKEFQVARVAAPADRKLQLALVYPGGGTGAASTIELPAGDTIFIIARCVAPGRLSIHAAGARRTKI